jgi:DNA-binding IclR family transcriptional regulator
MANVQSLERALTLLNKLSEYPEGIQISRLAEQVGLTKRTIRLKMKKLTNTKLGCKFFFFQGT